METIRDLIAKHLMTKSGQSRNYYHLWRLERQEFMANYNNSNTLPCVPEKAGMCVGVNISIRIPCALIWLSYIIATSFTKKLQQSPAQLVTYFWRYDPKLKHCCRQLLELFGLKQCFQLVSKLVFNLPGYSLSHNNTKDSDMLSVWHQWIAMIFIWSEIPNNY